MSTETDIRKFYFPRTLGDQMRIIGMPLDEFVPSVPVFLMSIYYRHALGGLIYGVTAWLFIRWLKRGRGSMWLYNMLYWHLPSEIFRVFYRVIPDASLRKWIR